MRKVVRDYYSWRSTPTKMSESGAVKALVEKYDGARMRSTGHQVNGKSKQLSRFRAGHSTRLDYEALQMLNGSSPFWGNTGPRWGTPRDRAGKRIHKRVMKKLRQPFRRKKRGPLRRRAAGKNEVTRRSGRR